VAGHHAVDALEQYFRGRFLQHNPARAELQRARDVGVVDAVGEHDGPHTGALRGDLLQGFERGARGGWAIEHENVGPRPVDEGDRVRSIARLADDEQARFGRQQPAQAISRNRMVISNDNPDGFRWIRRCLLRGTEEQVDEPRLFGPGGCPLYAEARLTSTRIVPLERLLCENVHRSARKREDTPFSNPEGLEVGGMGKMGKLAKMERMRKMGEMGTWEEMKRAPPKLFDQCDVAIVHEHLVFAG